jgi:hypothetical protein
VKDDAAPAAEPPPRDESKGWLGGLGVHEAGERPLVLDELSHQLDQLRILRKGGDDVEVEHLLDKLGAHDPVEHEMIVQLSAQRPLGHPERFAEAHALAMHSLEVLDRNGARAPSVPSIGPLEPIAAWAVQLVTRFIVRNHQADVIDAIRNIYPRRLAWSLSDDPQRLPLLKARNDAERVAVGYKGNPIGVPTFLVGGAVASGVAQLFSVVSNAAFGSALSAGLAIFIAFVLLASSAWCILRGAAIAHHRINLTVKEPLAALWETIGRAGKPPEDDAQMFAVYAIILTIVGWLLIPAGVFFVVAKF